VSAALVSVAISVNHATLKPLYVRVIPLEITGRRFKFGPEPDHEIIIG